MSASAISYSPISDDISSEEVEEVFVNERLMLECRMRTNRFIHRFFIVDQMSGRHINACEITEANRQIALDHAKALIGLTA